MSTLTHLPRQEGEVICRRLMPHIKQPATGVAYDCLRAVEIAPRYDLDRP